jgi:hypothetical protein
VTRLATIVPSAVQARSTYQPRVAPIVLREEAGARNPAAESFEAYRRQEDRLFAELRERIYTGRGADTFELGRYNPQSVVAELALDTPYNHSYELVPAGEPRGSVLLMHGLSDSPYAMRGIAEVFQSQGFHVVALRLPGHGTVPSVCATCAGELVCRGAVAANATRGGGGNPFYIGVLTAPHCGAHAVRSLDDPAAVHKGSISSACDRYPPFAALTDVISLAFIPAFEKSRWIDVLPVRSVQVTVSRQRREPDTYADGRAGRRAR